MDRSRHDLAIVDSLEEERQMAKMGPQCTKMEHSMK
jgi:hypothetical protein